MPRAEQEQEQNGLRGVATPMLASRFIKSGRVTATTLEQKGLTQTGVRKFINKSDEEVALKAFKDAAAKVREGVESILQESPDGDCRADGSSDGRHVVRVVPCAPKVSHAPKENRTSAEIRRRKYFVEAQLGAAEAEQRSIESGRSPLRVREAGARQGTVLSSFAKPDKTNEQLKADKNQTARDRDPKTLETKRAVPTAGVEEAKTECTVAATAVTSNTNSRAQFESQKFRPYRQERRC